MTDVSLRYLLFGEDRSASKAVQGVEGTASRSSKVVGASFSKMGSMVGGEVGTLIASVGDGLTSLGDSAKGMGPKLQVAGGALAGIGVGLSMLGSADKQAEASLSAAFTGIGKSVDDYKKQIDDVIKQQENYNHSAADTQNALATLTAMTHDPKKALESMGLVANLAAKNHIDLTSAATLVGRTLNGNVKLFKQYGIVVTSTTTAQGALTKAQTASKDAGAKYHTALDNLRMAQQSVAHGDVTGAAAKKLLGDATKKVTSAHTAYIAKQDAVKKASENVKTATDQQKSGITDLSKRLSGQAAASVDSFGGRLSVLKTKITDGAAAFGNKFGPALQVAGAGAMVLGTIMEIVKGRQAAAALATEAETGATVAQSVASKGAAAAQWLLNAAMTANPIGLVVAAIIGLVAAFILAWKHSATFRAIVTGALNAVKNAAMFVFNWIKDHWPLLLAILTGPFGIAVLLIVKNWGKIQTAASAVISWVTNAWGGFMGFLRGLPAKIGSIAASMWSGIGSAFRSMINGVIDIWNSLHFTIPSVHIFGKTIGGGTIGVPHIPHLAHGGVLTSSGAVVVGDGGNGSGAELLDLPAGARVRPLGAGTSGSGGDLGTLTVIVKSDTGEIIEQKLVKLQRTSGRPKLAFT